MKVTKAGQAEGENWLEAKPEASQVRHKLVRGYSEGHQSGPDRR